MRKTTKPEASLSTIAKMAHRTFTPVKFFDFTELLGRTCQDDACWALYLQLHDDWDTTVNVMEAAPYLTSAQATELAAGRTLATRIHDADQAHEYFACTDGLVLYAALIGPDGQCVAETMLAGQRP